MLIAIFVLLCLNLALLWDVSVKLSRINPITRKEFAAMARSLDEVLADVQDESTQIASLSTLTAGIKKQLDDALSGTTLPPDVQAKVDAVFTGVEANKQAVVDAINANTPVQPPAP